MCISDARAVSIEMLGFQNQNTKSGLSVTLEALPKHCVPYVTKV